MRTRLVFTATALVAFVLTLAIVNAAAGRSTPTANAACVTLRDGSVYCDPTSVPPVAAPTCDPFYGRHCNTPVVTVTATPTTTPRGGTITPTPQSTVIAPPTCDPFYGRHC